MSLSPAGRPADRGVRGAAPPDRDLNDFQPEFILSLSPAGRPAEPGVRGAAPPDINDFPPAGRPTEKIYCFQNSKFEKKIRCLLAYTIPASSGLAA